MSRSLYFWRARDRSGFLGGRVFVALLRRELVLGWRRKAEWLFSLVFFLMAWWVLAVAIEVESESGRLAAFWSAYLFASVLSVERLFLDDYRFGVLDVWQLSAPSLAAPVLAKASVHFLHTALPVLIVSLFILERGFLVVSLALGALGVSLIVTSVAALSLGARRGGFIAAFLALPASLPAPLFSLAALSYAEQERSLYPAFALLVAWLLATLVWAPAASILALDRVSSEGHGD